MPSGSGFIGVPYVLALKDGNPENGKEVHQVKSSDDGINWTAVLNIDGSYQFKVNQSTTTIGNDLYLTGNPPDSLKLSERAPTQVKKKRSTRSGKIFNFNSHHK